MIHDMSSEVHMIHDMSSEVHMIHGAVEMLHKLKQRMVDAISMISILINRGFLLNLVIYIFIFEKRYSANTVPTGIDRQMLAQVGNIVSTSLVTSSCNCDAKSSFGF